MRCHVSEIVFAPIRAKFFQEGMSIEDFISKLEVQAKDTFKPGTKRAIIKTLLGQMKLRGRGRKSLKSAKLIADYFKAGVDELFVRQ